MKVCYIFYANYKSQAKFKDCIQLPRIENGGSKKFNSSTAHFSTNLSIVFDIVNETFLHENSELNEKDRGTGLNIYKMSDILVKTICLGE